MKERTRAAALVLLTTVFALALGACGDDAVTPEPPVASLNIVVTAEPATFAPGDDVTLTVAVENPSDQVVTLGHGSSSCQFSTVICFDDKDRGMPSMRLCTADMGPLSLAPGARRTEHWVWNGDVVVDGTIRSLPSGDYEVKGVAGNQVGLPFTVEVRP